MKKLAVLISGRGSNLSALIAACADTAFPAEITIVIANRPGAAGLALAKKAGIATLVIDHKKYDDRAAFDAALDTVLRRKNVDLVCLAGFMRLLTDGFVNGWRGKMINIHPSLLPAFKGRDVHQRALDAGVTLSGCTVHYVTPEMDSGPIVAQAAVPVVPGDTAEALADRILAAEHVLYPHAVRLICEGRASFDGPEAGQAHEKGTDTKCPPLISPPL